MAEKLNTKTLNIPDRVVDSDWRDDIDTDYATREDGTIENFEFYGNDEKQEGEYISPSKVSKKSIKEIKSFQEKIVFNDLSKLKRELAKVA